MSLIFLIFSSNAHYLINKLQHSFPMSYENSNSTFLLYNIYYPWHNYVFSFQVQSRCALIKYINQWVSSQCSSYCYSLSLPSRQLSNNVIELHEVNATQLHQLCQSVIRNIISITYIEFQGFTFYELVLLLCNCYHLSQKL